jgi:hypothetical protein
MDVNDEIPKIIKPTKQAPSPISLVYNDYNFADAEGTHVTQSHYWRRVLGTNIPCGNSVSLKISTKAGVSHALLAEVASALEVGVAPLKNTLSMKMSVGDTFTNERSIEFTRNVGPKECIGITFAEWQKFVISTLRRQQYFLGFKVRLVERTLDIGTEETFPDQFEYPDPTCCPTEIQEKLAKGFDQLFALSFGSVSFAVFAKDKSNGKVNLAEIPGEFVPGQEVSLDEVGEYLAARGHVPQTAIRLGYSLGTVNDFYGWQKPIQGGSKLRTLPWVIALGCGSLLAYIFRTKSESRSDKERIEAQDWEDAMNLKEAAERLSRETRRQKEAVSAKAEEPRRELASHDE